MQDNGDDRRTLLYQHYEHPPCVSSSLFLKASSEAHIHQWGTGLFCLDHQLRAAQRPARSAAFPYPRTWVMYLRQIISITHGFASGLCLLGLRPLSSSKCRFKPEFPLWPTGVVFTPPWCCPWLFPIPPPMRGGRKWSWLLPNGKSLIFMTLHRTCTHTGDFAAICGDEAEICCAPWGTTKVKRGNDPLGSLVEGGLPVKLGVKLLISITDRWTYTHGFEPPDGWFGFVFTRWPKLPLWPTGTGVVCTLPWYCPWFPIGITLPICLPVWPWLLLKINLNHWFVTRPKNLYSHWQTHMLRPAWVSDMAKRGNGSVRFQGRLKAILTDLDVLNVLVDLESGRLLDYSEARNH